MPGRLVRLSGLAGAALLSTSAASRAQVVDAAPLAVFGPTSVDTRVGDLNALLGNLLSPQQSPEPRGLTLRSAIGVQELLTDNVYQVSRPRIADAVTTITPELTLSGSTRTIDVNATYQPQVQLYARTSQQDQVAQNFNGSALITAVPDTLFLSLRGYGSQQSANGNYGQSALPYYSTQNRTQTLSFEVSPYVQHRFGGDGTAQIGYVLNYINQSGTSPFTNTAVNAETAFQNSLLNANTGNGSTLSNEVYATYSTGENLGRFSSVTRLDIVQSSGSGNTVLNGSHRALAVDNVGYGLNRTVALIGSFGYQDLHYGGVPPYNLTDAIWSGGVRLTPNENSSLSLQYGHKDGFNSFTFSGSYAVTARLRVFGNYSEGLSTSQQEIQDNLDNTVVDQFGNTLGTVTGAPTVVSDQLLGVQNNLYRLKRATVTAATSYDRDTFSLSAEQETRTVVTSTVVGAGFSDHAISVNGTWTHALTPLLTTNTSLYYSHTGTQTTPVITNDTIGLNIGTSYQFSPSLTGTLQYYVNDRTSNQNSNQANVLNPGFYGQGGLQNAVIVGLRQSL